MAIYPGFFTDMFNASSRSKTLTRRNGGVIYAFVIAGLVNLIPIIMYNFYGYKTSAITIDSEKISIGNDDFVHDNISVLRLSANRHPLWNYITILIKTSDYLEYKVRVKDKKKLDILVNGIIESGLLYNRGFEAEYLRWKNGIEYTKSGESGHFVLGAK
jgi:hypothetical protein